MLLLLLQQLRALTVVGVAWLLHAFLNNNNKIIIIIIHNNDVLAVVAVRAAAATAPARVAADSLPLVAQVTRAANCNTHISASRTHDAHAYVGCSGACEVCVEVGNNDGRCCCGITNCCSCCGGCVAVSVSARGVFALPRPALLAGVAEPAGSTTPACDWKHSPSDSKHANTPLTGTGIADISKSGFWNPVYSEHRELLEWAAFAQRLV
jgi:hypothetical protein